jgi:hypothetical protein
MCRICQQIAVFNRTYCSFFYEHILLGFIFNNNLAIKAHCFESVPFYWLNNYSDNVYCLKSDLLVFWLLLSWFPRQKYTCIGLCKILALWKSTVITNSHWPGRKYSHTSEFPQPPYLEVVHGTSVIILMTH